MSSPHFRIDSLRTESKSTRRGAIPLKVFPGTAEEDVTVKEIIDTEAHGILRDFTGQFAKLLNRSALPEDVRQSLQELDVVRNRYAKTTRPMAQLYETLYPDSDYPASDDKNTRAKKKPVYNDLQSLSVLLNKKLVPDAKTRIRKPQSESIGDYKEYYASTLTVLAGLLEQENEPADVQKQRKTMHDALQMIVKENAAMQTAMKDFDKTVKKEQAIELGGVAYDNINPYLSKQFLDGVNWMKYCFYAETGASVLLDTMKSPYDLGRAVIREIGETTGQQSIVPVLCTHITKTSAIGSGTPLWDNPKVQALVDDAFEKTEVALTCCGKRPKTAKAAELLLQQEKDRAAKPPQEREKSHWAEYDDLIAQGCGDYLQIAGINDKETFDAVAAKHRTAVIGKWLDKSKQAEVSTMAADNSSDVTAPQGKCPFNYGAAAVAAQPASPAPVARCPFMARSK